MKRNESRAWLLAVVVVGACSRLEQEPLVVPDAGADRVRQLTTTDASLGRDPWDARDADAPAADAGAPPLDLAVCAALSEEMSAAIRPVMSLPQPCASPADCLHVRTYTQCNPACGGLLSVENAAALELALARADQVCARYLEAGCPAGVPPPCLGEQAYCVNGACSWSPPPTTP